VGRFGFGPTLDCAVPCSPCAPSEARHALDQFESDVEPGLLRDVKLIVSELVTNSVRHSGSDEPIVLRVWVRAGGLKVEIADGGFGFEPRTDADDDIGEGGRGLLILESLSDRWGVTRDRRTRVWFEVSERPVSAGSMRTG
jgi:anti-sigma regulatory factor (Ser/Thr protein kinase)